MKQADYYSTLGVLPEADDVVIKAAYRALAQRYHPDKWHGDATEANRRMAALNDAYAVLGNKQSREEYDRSREKTGHSEFGSKDNEAQEEAFDSALHDVEERWAIAVEVFPDLNNYRNNLANISKSLAFDFVTRLLDSKDFKNRDEISRYLEQVFLKRYFGENTRILAFAKSLILDGHKAAARKLNQLVDVLGVDVDPLLIIERVWQFPALREARQRREDYLKKLTAKDCYDQGAFTKVKELGYDCLLFANGQAARYLDRTNSLLIFASRQELRNDIHRLSEYIGSAPTLSIGQFKAWRGY